MRKLFTLAMMAVITLIANAQTETTKTIHGAVVDKNGNPIPGATVNATGGAESTLTEADGTFELEIPIWLKKVTASYGGYDKKTLKTKFDNDMIFRLLPKKTGGYFINAVGGLGIANEGEFFSVGIKGGHLGNWGWYGEFSMGLHYSTAEGHYQTVQAIAGAIRRLKNNNFIYLGAGYAEVVDYYDDSYDELYNGCAFDLGYLGMIGRHINLSVGITYTTDFSGSNNFIPKISVGYVF